MRRILLAAACLTATALSTPTPAFSQTLRIALRQDLDVMDPTMATTYVGRIVFAGLCDKLFDIDEKLNIVPQLATGYEWADDKTLVIHLRPGVKFQNGEVLDAAAVKYSLERHLTMQGSYRKGEVSSIDHVEVVDPATVRIVLKSPSGAFLAQLTDRSGMIAATQGNRGGGQGFRRASGVQRAVQIRRARGAGPHHAGALCRLLGRQGASTSTRSSIRSWSIRRCGWPTCGPARSILPNTWRRPTRPPVKQDPKLRLVLSDALGYFGITNNLANGPQCRHSVWPECIGAPGVRPGDRSRRTGQCRVQRHLRADRAGRAAEFAVLRRGAEGPDARSRRKRRRCCSRRA